jgi:hypothetical protein
VETIAESAGREVDVLDTDSNTREYDNAAARRVRVVVIEVHEEGGLPLLVADHLEVN